MSSEFYRAFEDKFRGSRELIKSRLQVYLPFIKHLKEIYSDVPVLDLGCGRGEWLELLVENGFECQGIDLDDGMLAACRELDLRVETGEAVSFLKNLPDESQVVISGFHLAEHIPFDDLQVLVEESLRVLRPAGILILETPNSENIVVGTSRFYFDPTHNLPIPSQLLAFLPEYYGFEKIKTIGLQEPDGILNSDNLNLMSVLIGVSPDYGVIAQKAADDKLLGLSSKLFETEYGVTLEQLATTYSQQIDIQRQQIEVKANQAEDKANQAEDKANQAQSQVHQIEAHAQQLYTELHSVYNSRSWRITYPIRWISHQLRLLYQHGLFSRVKALLKKIIRPIIRIGVSFVYSRPALRNFCVVLTKKVGCYNYICTTFWGLPEQQQPMSSVAEESIHLSSSASRIYRELKAAIEERQKESG